MYYCHRVATQLQLNISYQAQSRDHGSPTGSWEARDLTFFSNNKMKEHKVCSSFIANKSVIVFGVKTGLLFREALCILKVAVACLCYSLCFTLKVILL